MTAKSRNISKRRDRRKSKASNWSRVPTPGGKVGHHSYDNVRSGYRMSASRKEKIDR